MTPTQALSPDPWLDRYFSRLLPGISLIGVIPALWLGYHQQIDTDGWWHLFTAAQDRWSMFLGEWKYESHPPLHYLLLRFVALFGHSHLVLRSIGIASAAFSTYFIGIIGAKLYSRRASAVLLAAAYTFSWNMIDLNCSVRGYPLALLFTLLAFNAYIDWTADPAGPRAGRTVLRIGAWSLLAICSQYYVIFFLAGCFVIACYSALTRPAFRDQAIASVRTYWKQYLVAFVSVSGLFLAFYIFHMRVNVDNSHFLEEFLYREDSSPGIDVFLMSHLESEAGFFAPFNLAPSLILALTFFLFLPMLIYFGFGRKARPRLPGSSVPPLLLAVLLLQIVLLSLFGKYPFGGGFRHQSIVAPFVFLTAFLLADRVLDALKSPFARTAAFAAIGLAIAASFSLGAVDVARNTADPPNAEYSRFREIFPAPDAIYTDTTSAILYYSHRHNAKWTFLDRFLVDGQRIAVYNVDDSSGHPIRFMRNKRVATFSLDNPEIYSVLANLMRRESLKSAVLFYEGVNWKPEVMPAVEESLRTLSVRAGLQLGRYTLGSTSAFVEFKLP